MTTPPPGAPTLTEPEPWPDPVAGSQLLDEISHDLRRFIVFAQPLAAETVALWIAHTHVLDAADHSPLLGIVSPEKRCGKTTLLDLIAELSYKAAPITHVTTANLFRSIADGYRTLILDEADAYLDTNLELIALLNRGHTKAGAFTMRREKSVTGFVPVWFPLWSAKAIASIGKLWHTLADRSIRIPMRRAGKSEAHERVFAADRVNLRVSQRKLRRWSLDNTEAVSKIDPALPDELNSREADNWRILAAIADVVGDRWPAVTRQASLALRVKDSDIETPSIQLLTDIRAAFQGTRFHFVPTEELLATLYRYDDSWRHYDYGKPIDAKKLASLLSDFEITSQRHRIAEKAGKPFRGYLWQPFETAFAHYLPPDDAETPDDAEHTEHVAPVTES
jgi:hypothetical protein